MTGLVEAITEPEADLPERLRATMALGSVSIGWMFFADQVKDRSELCAAVLDIARDLAKAAPEANPGRPQLAPLPASHPAATSPLARPLHAPLPTASPSPAPPRTAANPLG